MKTVIVAGARREADQVRRDRGIRWRDAVCVGTARRGSTDTFDGVYPDTIITVPGWDAGREAAEAAARITSIVAKRQTGAVSVVAHA